MLAYILRCLLINLNHSIFLCSVPIYNKSNTVWQRSEKSAFHQAGTSEQNRTQTDVLLSLCLTWLRPMLLVIRTSFRVSVMLCLIDVCQLPLSMFHLVFLQKFQWQATKWNSLLPCTKFSLVLNIYTFTFITMLVKKHLHNKRSRHF